MLSLLPSLIISFLIAVLTGLLTQISTGSWEISLTLFVGAAITAFAGTNGDFVKILSEKFKDWRKKASDQKTHDDFMERISRNSKRNDIFTLTAINYDYSLKIREISPNNENVVLKSDEGPGGSGANTAYLLSKMGRRVSVCGVIGTDAIANEIVADFDRAGVNQDHLMKVEGPSGETVIIVDSHGRRSINILPHANEALHTLLTGDRLETVIQSINDSNVFHLSSFVDPEQMKAPISAILNSIDHDVIVSYVPGDLQTMQGKNSFNEMIFKRSDIVFFYEHQITTFTEGDRRTNIGEIQLRETVRKFRDWKREHNGRTPFAVCIKHAENTDGGGSTSSPLSIFRCIGDEITRFSSYECKPIPGVHYFDGTGAGDAAAAGLLDALMNQKPWQDAVNRASIVSLCVASQIGPRNGIEKLLQIDTARMPTTPD